MSDSDVKQAEEGARLRQKAEIWHLNRKLLTAARELEVERDLVQLACFWGNLRCIRKLSLILLVKLHERNEVVRKTRNRKKDDPDNTSISPVREGGAVSPTTVSALAYYMVARSAKKRRTVPTELVDLLSECLGIAKWRAKRETQQPEKIYRAIRLIRTNPDIGARRLARQSGLPRSTASDLKKDFKDGGEDNLLIRFTVGSNKGIKGRVWGSDGHQSAPIRIPPTKKR